MVFFFFLRLAREAMLGGSEKPPMLTLLPIDCSLHNKWTHTSIQPSPNFQTWRCSTCLWPKSNAAARFRRVVHSKSFQKSKQITARWPVCRLCCGLCCLLFRHFLHCAAESAYTWDFALWNLCSGCTSAEPSQPSIKHRNRSPSVSDSSAGMF